MRATTLACLCTAAALLLVPAIADDAPRPEPKVYRGAVNLDLVVPYVIDMDLRALPERTKWRPGDPMREIPRRYYPGPNDLADDATQRSPEQGPDPLLQLQSSAAGAADPNAFSPPDLNFAGEGYSGVVPPDPAGDVGTNYYIQMVNGSGGSILRIYDKSNGNLVVGPTNLDTLGSGFCASGAGDPIVLYDQFAGRWVLSEFSASGNRLCVYVSQSGDPVSGGWWAYAFQAPNFPDYPKYAVWPDAYFVSSNEAGGSPVYAMERSQMLVGGTAALQRFEAPDLAGFGFQALTPGDADGNLAPPAGSPGYFLRHRDDERHNGGSANPSEDYLEVWEFSVDFANAANSSFTGPFDVALSEFDSGLCGFTSFSCFPQPSASQLLDPLREVVMFRLQYRNVGSHEMMVGNLVTDVNGADRGGIRWFELRKSGGGNWTLFQEGTYSPDATHRWMGAISMDGSGNIAMSYNVSSGSVQPGIRYAGRLAGDPSGALPQGEHTLIAGTSSIGTNRFGDYNAMNVDPVDDCTFWTTAEYTAGGVWETQIGAFSFASCGGTCGNGVAEGGEACDGADLNGQSCASQGCSGGTLACDGSCAFDLSGCTGCPVCDNDGTCESGEDCNSCPGDCPSGSTNGAVCGNGVCEAGNGENCLTCSADCNGKQNGNPNGRYCCGDGSAGAGAVTCADARCGGPSECTNDPVSGGSYCCGDLTCDDGEDCGNCPLDCAAGPENCTNGSDDDCDGFVDCADSDCASDPACQCQPTSEVCNNGTDDDCDGDIDCADADCTGNPSCGCQLGQLGDPCSSNGDCCSNKCKGPPGGKTCK